MMLYRSFVQNHSKQHCFFVEAGLQKNGSYGVVESHSEGPQVGHVDQLTHCVGYQERHPSDKEPRGDDQSLGKSQIRVQIDQNLPALKRRKQLQRAKKMKECSIVLLAILFKTPMITGSSSEAGLRLPVMALRLETVTILTKRNKEIRTRRYLRTVHLSLGSARSKEEGRSQNMYQLRHEQ